MLYIGAPVYELQHAIETLQAEDLTNYMFTRDQRDLCPRRDVHNAQYSEPTRRYVSEKQKIQNHQKEIG